MHCQARPTSQAQAVTRVKQSSYDFGPIAPKTERKDSDANRRVVLPESIACPTMQRPLVAIVLAATSAISLAQGVRLTVYDDGLSCPGDWISEDSLASGCQVGIDFAEYSWDRNRPLDIDHIVVVGEDSVGKFVSQSSSDGGGVNRVSLDRWLESTRELRAVGRMHMVDLLELQAR